MKPTVVLYHNDCPDGFGAAWAAWKKFGSRAAYLPAFHQQLPDPAIKNREVYLVDFAYFGDELKRFVARNTSVVILDHHISAKPHVKLATEHRYADNHSGAVLAWQYFHPGKKVPLLLRYIEDTDLWKFKLAHAKEFSAAIQQVPYTFAAYEKLAKEFETASGRKALLAIGAIVLAYEDAQIKKLIALAEEAVFEGRRAGVVNSPLFQSQIGHALYDGGYPVAIVWSKQNGHIRVSLRSSGTVDVSKLAEKYGGGGHKAAAGFKLSGDKKLPWRYTKRRP